MTVAFKPEHSLYLTPTLYFELRTPMFIINGCDRKASACGPWTSCIHLISPVKSRRKNSSITVVFSNSGSISA